MPMGQQKNCCFNPLQVQTKQVSRQNLIMNTKKVSIPYRYKQNMAGFVFIIFVFTVLFQSPIGTNKTVNRINLTLESGEFQSPIGTNKSLKQMWQRQRACQFQSPIGTNKKGRGSDKATGMVWFQSPIGTNKTCTKIAKKVFSIAFQSPIGTNKRIEICFI